MMVRVMCVGVAMLATGGAAAPQMTTVSEEMKLVVELEVRAPECYYEFDGKTLSWTEPDKSETHYLHVHVHNRDSSEHVGGAKAVGLITSMRDKALGTSITLHETWDAEWPHYGANVKIPDDMTSGNVAIRIEPPKGRRLGRDVGDFFTKPVTVKFEGVEFGAVEPGAMADEMTTDVERVDWPEGRRPYVEPTPYPGAAR